MPGVVGVFTADDLELLVTPIEGLKPSPQVRQTGAGFALLFRRGKADPIVLDDDAPVGKPLVDYMGDIVLELEVTPNMARCLSMIGVAREVAALTGQVLRLPPQSVRFSKPIALDSICQTCKSILPIQKQNGAPPHLARDAPSCDS